jgi:hypothetical protein
MARDDSSFISGNASESSPGPFLARVISHQDTSYMGVLEVEILRPQGTSSSEGQLHQVKYMSPFWGQTSIAHVGENNDYNGTQKSYGMWMIPPDVGSTVMIFFVDGDPKRGYWFGCVPDENANFMVPGIAATEYTVDGEGRVPVAEYNKKATDVVADPTQALKPKHPLAQILEDQGLLKDDSRGITTSSSRRETPSMVFGISTPGPVDKQDGATRGRIGKKEWAIKDAFVSRLGGSTFVMDDGDDKFLRKTPASDGPPEYVSVEQDGPSGAEKTIPHNELIRIRTRTGHQILLHNSEDLIYIGNARGTSWIELTSDGKIDIYAEDSVSLHTKQDLNFYADRDINFECGRNFNLKVAERHQTEVGTNKVLIVTENNTIEVKGTHDETITGATKLTVKGGFDLNTTGANKFTASGATNIRSGGNHVETAARIDMNGPAAATAATATAPEALPTFANPDETESTTDSIMLRIPSHEPWPHHENLDPESFKPEMTDREAGSDIAVPAGWKEYSTTTDTFAKVSD